jgi:pimeloyl-ACP methyl ester carboxylesterase
MDYNTTPLTLNEHILERKGCPLHYWIGGPEDKPLIVLMHGGTMDHRMFNPQVEALIPEFRVLVWDARGHGKSQPIGNGFDLIDCAEDMLIILDEIGVDKAVIGGQSMGGLIAQRLYQLAPKRVSAIIVIGSAPIAKAYVKAEVLMLKATMPMFNLWPHKHFMKVVANSCGKHGPTIDYALQAIGQISRKDFLTIWKGVSLAVDDKGIPGFVHKVPLLLIHGDEDKSGTIARDMPLWAEWEPQCTYAVIPNAAHNANQDNPEETNRLITEFLIHYSL